MIGKQAKCPSCGTSFVIAEQDLNTEEQEQVPEGVKLPPRGAAAPPSLPVDSPRVLTIPRNLLETCPACGELRAVSGPLCVKCGNVSTWKTISLAVKVSLAVLLFNSVILFVLAIVMRTLHVAGK